MVEHATDTLFKYEVGSDGRTAYERMKGKPCSHEIAEFGENTIAHTQKAPGGRMIN